MHKLTAPVHVHDRNQVDFREPIANTLFLSPQVMVRRDRSISLITLRHNVMKLSKNSGIPAMSRN